MRKLGITTVGYLILFVLMISILLYMFFNKSPWVFDNVIDSFKSSITILISMFGYSVSIYVFLMNVLSNRAEQSVAEKEVISEFREIKKNELVRRLVFTILVILFESVLILFKTAIKKKISTIAFSTVIYIFFAIIGCGSTLVNIIFLGIFTYSIINYEDGLKTQAVAMRKRRGVGPTRTKMMKGEFLNLVNNIEVLVERLIANHMHAKMSNEYESNFKRALCDGITDAGQIQMREETANEYKEVIDYRNLLLQDEELGDAHEVGMSDKIQLVKNNLFTHYLSGEVLRGISINHLPIRDADLSKTSFYDSSLQDIVFMGESKFVGTDFRNSFINNVKFGKANCKNINFSDAKLIDVRFTTDMQMERSVFVRADLSNLGDLGPEDKDGTPLKFTYSDFEDANMAHLDIYNASFEYASLKFARLTACKIGTSAQKAKNVNFRYADFTRANLLESSIHRCDFQKANLTEANLTHTDDVSVDFSECNLGNVILAEAVISHCNFNKSFAQGISLKGTQIANTKFDYAIMNNADFSNAEISESSFDDVVFRNSLWVRTAIANTSFCRSVFSGARIAGESQHITVIRNCNFSFANLSDCAITNIEFEKCDFKGVDLTNARLINVCFDDCDNLNTAVTKYLWASELKTKGNSDSLRKDKWRYHS